MKVKVRIIKAKDDSEATEKYIQGHLNVLATYGVTKVTSADTSWTEDSNVYLILVEAIDDNRILGGARIQLNSEAFPLPVVEATKDLDAKILDYISDFKPLEMAELCGLWNSKEVAGYGIGSIYLGRVGVAISSQLNIKRLLAFCSPATLRNCYKVGFRIISTLGDNGKFFYPKEGLIATALEIDDIENLSSAHFEDRDFIFKLRNNLSHLSQETGPKGSMDVEFDLKLPHLTSTSHG
ncbi:hypothetical protein [Anditalea andensis]|uniref:N-acetyltransferase domain-containing protein n=1 Tax=Anditalea andensis TaxID=1048983 RepID=A0A074L2L7_9BACT|nr:hypothetical protein [Anditalea andensis]KEO74710.1 hypothetical protein EL17_03270 [Anditalea andensis]